MGLLLNESTGKGISGLTSAGHSAVYLSNICPASPVTLRLCEPGEQGSVISNYTDFGEAKSYEWNIVPLSVFLYGVEDPADRPLYGTEETLRLLQDRYRQRHLTEICPARTCGGTADQQHWRDMVGGTFVRQVYLFRVKTTPAQDAVLIREFNTMRNENRYNGFTNNCADFARSVVNRYFPGAAKPDHLNDFGMTSPKAISKSFSRYGEKRPQLEFSAERFSQLPGPIKRSSPCRKGTEVSFRLKKWLVPLLVARSHELPFFLAAYSLTGRFNPDTEVKRHPPRMADPSATALTWKSYKLEFDEILGTAFNDGLFANQRDLADYFKDLNRTGHMLLDERGLPVLEIGTRRVGLSRSNLLSPESDPKLAYKLMLARVEAMLTAPAGRRESFYSFEQDWAALISARDRLAGR